MADPQRHRLTMLDHVNIRTTRVEPLAAFYVDVLGLARGPRPPFPFGGAWLYCGENPVVHLVDDKGALSSFEPSELRLSHFAFRATGMAAFLARLEQAGVAYVIGRPPASPVVQVNLRDPDGNAIHVDFTGEDTGEAPSR